MGTLFPISKLRWPKLFTSAIFSDESSQGERFFVLGALYFWWKTEDYKNQIAKFEAEFARIKLAHDVSVIKWQDVPRPSRKFNGYKACIEYLASQNRHAKDTNTGETIGSCLRFKCLVVDTRKYPLKNKAIGSDDKLVGYLKFYTVHLANGIMLPQRGYFYDIAIDSYQWPTERNKDADSLGRAIEGRYLKEFKPADPTINKYKFQHSVLTSVDDKDSNLIQMADLLTGAVAFVRNGGLTRTSVVSETRKELVSFIQRCYRGLNMARPQPKGPFAIWDFKDPGKPRSPTRPGEAPYLP
jgi:hypothetical protein